MKRESKSSYTSLKVCFLAVLILLGANGMHTASAASDYPIVFVSRNHAAGGSIHYPQMGLLPGAGPYSRFAVTGGSLLLLQSNSTVTILVDSTIAFGNIRIIDVSDPCVHWDAQKILFAGIEHRDSSWRIYETGINGSGFRKLTFSDRNLNLEQFGNAAGKFVTYDDIDPCYLPDGRICFSSTRYPSLSFTGFRTTNLYVMNSDGSGMRRITTERNGAEEPSVDPVTGKIIFSRWWHNIDMPSRLTPNGITRDTALALTNDVGNVWWAAGINPDGSNMEMYAGSAYSRNAMHAYKPAVISGNRLLSVFSGNTSLATTSGSSGIRWINRGAGEPRHIAGVNMDNMVPYNNFPLLWGILQPPYATDPAELPDGRVMFSMAGSVENQDYGIFSAQINGSGIQTVIDIPGKLELNAAVLLPVKRPPVINDFISYISDELPPVNNPSSFFKNGALRFDCGNIFTNAGVDVPVPDAPPLTRNARIKLFLNFQRTDSTGKDSAILFLDNPVQYSGGFWIPEIPADVPVFDQVTDSAGKVLSSGNGQFAHLSGLNFGRAGTGTQCVGCHAGHSFIPPPQNNFLALFTNASTSASVTESSFRTEGDTASYPGSRVKDRKAVNDYAGVNWIAAGEENEWVDLKWNIPIDVRQFVIYNIKPDAFTNTDITVTDCEIFMYLGGKPAGHILSTGPIVVNGTPVITGNYPKIDQARIVVKSFTGLVRGIHSAGLAEVETNARISYYDVTEATNAIVLPDGFELMQNYPNPFNPETKIAFKLPAKGNVKIKIFDIAGREMTTVADGVFDQGSHETIFSAGSSRLFPSGVYFYKMEFQPRSLPDKYFTKTKRMIFLK